MWRIIVQPALLFLTPFAAYFVYLALWRTYPFTMEHWSRSTVSKLTLAGLLITVIGMLLFGIFVPRHSGAYVPAHIEDGRLVPGQIQ
jgi:hypothetical protein